MFGIRPVLFLVVKLSERVHVCIVFLSKLQTNVPLAAVLLHKCVVNRPDPCRQRAYIHLKNTSYAISWTGETTDDWRGCHRRRPTSAHTLNNRPECQNVGPLISRCCRKIRAERMKLDAPRRHFRFLPFGVRRHNLFHEVAV